MRRKVIAGNWKMNMLPNEAIDFIQKLEPIVKDTKNDIIICSPYIDLFYAISYSQGTNIHIGAQNMHEAEKGAFTGEVSGKMLKSINCEYVIIGHSERRQYFNETDESVNNKIKSALSYELKPILCVGENLEQKETGETINIITSQIENDLKGLTKEDLQNIIVAYEPIWAIGTGKTATSQDAEDTIKAIREKIKEMFGTDDITILYGGSCKPDNAKELFSMPDIDGGLIGGASLEVEKFVQIIDSE